ncbi:hypothetical protein D3C72_1791980 [compost metagenome]
MSWHVAIAPGHRKTVSVRFPWRCVPMPCWQPALTKVQYATRASWEAKHHGGIATPTRRPLRRGVFASGAPLAGIRGGSGHSVTGHEQNFFAPRQHHSGEARRSSAGAQLQAARGLCHDRQPERRAESARRGNGFGRQPCAGRGLLRKTPGDQNADRHAGVHRRHQSGCGTRFRRRSTVARRQL